MSREEFLDDAVDQVGLLPQQAVHDAGDELELRGGDVVGDVLRLVEMGARAADVVILVADENQRRGRTLSIDWPLWREGGMRVDPGLEKLLQKRTGLVPMATATGLAAFYRGLALDADQVVILEGDPAQLRRWLELAPSTGN